MCKLDNILNKCRQGDRRAEEQLYRMYATQMFTLCVRYSRNRAEAEDNFQDGFIRVFESLGQYAGKGSFEGWMKRIFIRISLEKYRKVRPLQLMEELPEEPEDEPGMDWQLPAEVLNRFVEELPEKYRLVFHLYVMEEMQHKEIAALTGITEGTSKSNLARARNILKKKITEYLKNE